MVAEERTDVRLPNPLPYRRIVRPRPDERMLGATPCAGLLGQSNAGALLDERHHKGCAPSASLPDST